MRIQRSICPQYHIGRYPNYWWRRCIYSTGTFLCAASRQLDFLCFTMKPKIFSCCLSLFWQKTFSISTTIEAYICFSVKIVAIVVARSSEGVSIASLAIGFISATFVMINKLILNWYILLCCSEMTGSQCLGNNLAVWQTIVVPAGILVTLLTALIFFPMIATKEISIEDRVRARRLASALSFGTIFLCVAAGATAAFMHYVGGIGDNTIKIYAQALGIAAAVANVLHWSPQIYYTGFVLKSVKNLSVLGLAFQFPGSVLIVIFQGFVNHADWSTWAPAFLSGLQQGILIVLCLVFMWRDYRAKSRPELAPLLDSLPCSRSATDVSNSMNSAYFSLPRPGLKEDPLLQQAESRKDSFSP